MAKITGAVGAAKVIGGKKRNFDEGMTGECLEVGVADHHCADANDAGDGGPATKKSARKGASEHKAKSTPAVTASWTKGGAEKGDDESSSANHPKVIDTCSTLGD